MNRPLTDRLRAVHWAGWVPEAATEAFLAFLAAGVFYASLWGELPYHDELRFVEQINSGAFVWDIAHIFLQPATLLWHKYLGFGEGAAQSQKHINSFATAAAIGIFHYTLRWLNVAGWRRWACSALLAASFSVLILAPSGHMKLVAFPFVNGALLSLIMWEQQRHVGRLIAGAVLLAVAGAFLASALATVPFATIAVFTISLRHHGTLVRAVKDAALLAGVCAIAFAACAAFGYVTFSGQPLTVAGLVQSVAYKASLRPSASAPSISITTLARLVFGTVDNFIAAPDFGAVARALLGGQIHDLRPYLRSLAWEVVPLGATFSLLALIYLRTAWSALRGEVRWMPLAFLCGAQAWTIYYGLNDPEHWFQLSAPTIILYLQTLPEYLIQWTLPVWAAGTLAVNLALYAIPQATYPLHRYERQLSAMYSDADLIVYFIAYAGTHYIGFFDLPYVRMLPVDRIIEQSGNPQEALARIRGEILATLDAGGKVTAYSFLDPQDWNGGWAVLTGRGIAKSSVTKFFFDNFKVEYIGQVAEMPAWKIEKR